MNKLLKTITLGIFCLATLIYPKSTSALSPAIITTWSPFTNYWADCRTDEVFQSFISRGYTLDAVGLYLYVDPTLANPDQSAKVQITVYNMSSIWQYGVVESVSKLITDDQSWKTINFTDKFLSPGTYAIGVKTINSDSNLLWAGTTSNNYLYGSAIFDDEVHEDIDLGFTIYGTYPASTNEPVDNGSQPNPAQPDPDQPVSSSSPASITPSTPSATSPSSSTGNQTDASSPNNNASSSSPSSSTPSKTTTANQQTTKTEQPPGDLSKVNEKQSSTAQPMTDAELQEFLAFIKSEHEKNNAQGIFGLGGVFGRILTWKNIGIFFGLIFLLIILRFVLRRKAKAETPTTTS